MRPPLVLLTVLVLALSTGVDSKKAAGRDFY
eukprot:COSAG05_NODE_20789_length_277_cov_0.398876_1_plen_30_part_01